jgi:DNA-binding ferritin-like protein (Dps family)
MCPERRHPVKYRTGVNKTNRLSTRRKQMKNLETRIKNIAANMEGNFKEIDGYVVPHAKFVEWDQTWDIADDLELSDDSTEEEIEQAILSQEDSHYDYYDEQVEEYVEELRDAKFSKDADAFDEKTVDLLFEAFSNGVGEAGYRERANLPGSSSEIREAARKVLDQEAKDRKVRQDALLEAQENDFQAFGYPSNNWNRPDETQCPLSLDEFDYAGGEYFMDDENMSLEDALRECMKKAYVGWFDENTIRM